MTKGAVGTIIKLLIASLLVGLVMHWFGITPRNLIHNFGDSVVRIFGTLTSFIDWAVDYILVGAVIVVPIWLIVFLADRAKRNRSS